MAGEKEGLLERSRKFLSGSKSLDSKQHSNQDTGSDSTSGDRSRYQRRRDQVRRAQRSHRERKENYIKALEQEILELRTNPASRVRTLEAQIAFLKQLLANNAVALPSTWQSEAIKAFDDNPNAVAWFSEQPGPIQVARPNPQQQTTFNQHNPLAQPLSSNLQGTNYALAEPAAAFIGRDPLKLEEIYNLPTNYTHSQPPETATTAAQKALPQTPAIARRNELLNAGVDFVLTLERGCMGHLLEAVPSSDQASTGHSLLASHHLLAYAPRGVDAQTNWQVPQATLDNLLMLSTQFDLGGEITPVQAWHKLKHHPRFLELTASRIQNLAEKLAPDTDCFGFGAVLEKTWFDSAVAAMFSQA